MTVDSLTQVKDRGADPTNTAFTFRIISGERA